MTIPIPESNLITTLVNIASGATVYVPVPIRDGTVCATIAWKDAVSSATITFEVSNYDSSPDVAGAAWEWGTATSSPTITGPAATGAGVAPVTVANCWFRQARFKVVTAAVTNLEFRDNGQDGPITVLAAIRDLLSDRTEAMIELLTTIADKR